MHPMSAFMATLTLLLSTLGLSHHPRICIDPGHGGQDPGAINQDITEAQETLDIGRRLEKLLTVNNYTVVMTRTDNTTTLSNSQRADICNNSKSDLLISIHLNANENTTFDYTQGLYGTGKESKDKQFTQLVHQALVSSLQLPDFSITDFGDNILLKAKMPATLQETVFITNPTEYQLLTDGTEHRQQQIAQALYNGIQQWFSEKKNK